MMGGATSRPVSDRPASGLVEPLRMIRQDMIAAEASSGTATMPPERRPSARNLAHYLAFRRHDVRPLQGALARAGLSSLGRSEACVLSSVEAVLHHTEREAGLAPVGKTSGAVSFDEAQSIIAARIDELFGPAERTVRIMVTLPTRAATDPAFVVDLVAAGMDCARINCAHDAPAEWSAMARNVREAADRLNRNCRVVMDLPGPKLRTGLIEPVPGEVRVRCGRRAGERTAGHAWLSASSAPAPAGVAAVIPVKQRWLNGVRPGDELMVRDRRGGKRLMIVSNTTHRGALALAPRSIRLAAGSPIKRLRDNSTTRVGELPSMTGSIPLRVGDPLVLTRDQAPGRPASRTSPAAVPCQMHKIFDHVEPGQRVAIDDGTFAGAIEDCDANQITIRIAHAPDGGGRLRTDRGINLPDTDLPALVGQSEEDREALTAAAELADIVGLSFVSRPSEITAVLHELRVLSPSRTPGIILKVETERAFNALHLLLFAALAAGVPFGVMIARGDLAIECGWERMAEVQEEILWVCEAAHTPVIWATQVLESLAKTGLPSRAEITDAAMSSRAECVMLNKGPMIEQAIHALDDILRRMEAHQHKKRPLLRPLAAWRTPASDIEQSTPEVDTSDVVHAGR